MMEEKAVISLILRNFDLKSETKIEEVPLMAELVLRPKNGLKISLKKR